MKRVFTWSVVAAAAFFCLISGFFLYGTLMDYAYLRNDIDRQLCEIDKLRTEGSGQASRRANMQNAQETVSYISSQITVFELSEQTLRSEKGSPVVEGWDEWRIEAVCTGTIENLCALVDSLETAGAYHNVNFTIDKYNGDIYVLSVRLSFYARHV